SVEKIDTLFDGDTARTKIKDFRTALYPRQYHPPCALEKPLNWRFSLIRYFSAAPVSGKIKCGVYAA
ncbi:MAG: hypothetical protein U0K18_02680, partial [Acutalibacteraceae bacterium]|nr:hypothetical protein [Acutalibacteraceae bacterium]